MHVVSTLATVLAASVVVATAIDVPSNATASQTAGATAPATEARKLCSIGLRGVNIIGRDIGSVRETNEYDGCRAHCVANAECKWYTWTDFEGGTCWLKSGDTLQIEVNGQANRAYSAFVRYMDVCPKAAFVLKGTDWFGGDIGDTPGANPEACYDICNAWPDCEVFVWSQADKGPTCWLKHRVTGVRDTPGVYTGYLLQSYS